MTHDPNYLKYVVQMQVYKMSFICWFNAIVGPENDQLLKSSIYPVYYIKGKVCVMALIFIIQRKGQNITFMDYSAENDTKFVTKVEIH